MRTNLKAVKVLWCKLSDIPINTNEEIEENFQHFNIGTHREEIWHWFEQTFNVSVAKDLMLIN